MMARQNEIERNESANSRLVEARKLVEKMHAKGESLWIRFFYPEKAKIASEWARRARQDLWREDESEKTIPSLSQDHPQIQAQSHRPLTTELNLSDHEQEVLSEVRMRQILVPFVIGIGAIASAPAWLPKVANVTTDEAALYLGIALVFYFFMSLHLMAEHWNYNLTEGKWIIKDGKTDSMATVDRYNALVQEEQVETRPSLV